MELSTAVQMPKSSEISVHQEAPVQLSREERKRLEMEKGKRDMRLLMQGMLSFKEPEKKDCN